MSQSIKVPRKIIGIVTITFNAENFLYPFLMCCKRQTYIDFQLLVIDNLSTDNTVNVFLKVGDSRFHIDCNTSNIGYAAACNQGVRYFMEMGVKEVLFINNDTEFAADLFESLVMLRRSYNADAVTPRVSLSENTDINWYAGGRFTFWKGFQGEHIGEGKHQDSADIEPRWTPVAPGCCILFSIFTFKSIGLFDPNYFVYFEDTDYFVRMLRAQLRLLYAPNVVVRHKISLSTGGTKSNFSIRYYHRNQIYLLRKHFHPIIVALQILLVTLKISVRLLLRRDTFRQYILRLSSLNEGLWMPIPLENAISQRLKPFTIKGNW